jgi:hypothetical protein
MAKKKAKSANTTNGAAPERGAKSAAIREYYKAHKGAKPKEVIAALKAQGIDVSTNLVSVIRATAGVKKAKRVANAAVASNDQSAGAKLNKSRGLEAALTLYRAAKGAEVPGKQVSGAFLALVEMLS